MPADEFTAEQADILKEHFSNTDRSVFVITTPHQTDRGALMSRYSRSSKSMRRVFLDEFLNNPHRGSEFYDRVLTEYGDDSVAELGHVQLGLEGVSNLAVQTIEDRRIGMSFLEKSSRYVSWIPEGGKPYAYYMGDDIVGSRHEKTYEDACNLSFDTYTGMADTLERYVRERHPIESYKFIDSQEGIEKPFERLRQESDIRSAHKIYDRTAKAMTLDSLRTLLPAAALTNVGVSGNGRAFEYLIGILGSSELNEERMLAASVTSEIETVMAPFVRRARGEYGMQLKEYLRRIRQEATKYTISAGPVPGHTIRLVSCEPEGEALDKVVAALLYEGSGMLYGQMLDKVSGMPVDEKRRMVQSFASLRGHRRHRPPRAFESTVYVFDMVINYGIFRDLHRHRILSMQRQMLTTRHGFDMPTLIESAGMEKPFRECMASTVHAFDTIHKSMPYQAQYVVNFAFNYPCMIQVNLRELCHVVELRTMPAGHSDYRLAAQQMYRQVQERHPYLSEIIRFVDMSGYDMGRMDSERRSEGRLAALDRKADNTRP